MSEPDVSKVGLLAVAALYAAVQEPPDVRLIDEAVADLIVIEPEARGLFAAMVFWARMIPGTGRTVDAQVMVVDETGETVNADELTDTAEGWGVVNGTRLAAFAVSGDLGGARAVFDSPPDSECGRQMIHWVLRLAVEATRERMKARRS